MGELSGIYDSAPIQPVCRIKENLAVWTRNLYEYYQVRFIEGIPRSSQSVVEMITATGRVSLAANGNIPKVQLAPLLLNEGEFLHLRFDPIDDVEGILWEQPSQGRFATRAIQARVTLASSIQDPYLAATTFFLMGRDRLMNLQVNNPNPVLIFVARFVFWGYRYYIDLINLATLPQLIKEMNALRNQEQAGTVPLGASEELLKNVHMKLQMGDRDTAKQYIGAVTWLPAEGLG